MFENRSSTIRIADKTYKVHPDVTEKIHLLHLQIDGLVQENQELKKELNAIKPVLSSPDLTPALSAFCKECDFAVRSNWDGSILGCCKNLVCEDFKKESKNEAR